MIEASEIRTALATYGADLDRAAYRLAVGLSDGDTRGGYQAHLEAEVREALTEALLGSEFPTREDWEQAVAEDEAWDAAERLREAGAS